MTVHLEHGVVIADDVLPDPVAYRTRALANLFTSISFGPGETFHGIAEDTDGALVRRLTEHWPQLTPRLSFFRRSPAGQGEPHYVHSDEGMGEWTGIFYLVPDPPPSDGTIFWRHEPTEAIESDGRTVAWDDRRQWQPRFVVTARFNRLLLFRAPLFHSRALEDNYGDGETARLIQVIFGTGALAPEGEA